MLKACLALAFFCLVLALPAKAFNWETETSRGREYVSLRSFCTFYGFTYSVPSGNDRFTARNAGHSLSIKIGSPDLWLDGVHYVMSFPIEGGDHDWLVSRMDVIKLFEPILRPTQMNNRHAIRGVVIDAGHGGTDNGAVSSRGGMEKRYTLDTANRLEGILRAAGIKTVLTRRTDVFVDLYERAHIASLYPDYCFVSIHYNSATEEAHGLETYCLSPRGAASTSSAYLTRGDIQKLLGNDDDTLNIALASMVHSEIIRLNPGDQSADRGVKRARFVVIKQNVLPAILVEGGFVSNRMEAARINQDDYRQKLASAIARGVIRFMNVMGNWNRSLPSFSSSGGSDDDDSKPAPRAIPVAAEAPTGLASDPLNGKNKKGATKPATPVAPAKASSAKIDASATTPDSGKTATNSKSKKNKKKTTNVAATPAPTATPAPAATQPEPATSPSEGPMNPATPAADATATPAPTAPSPSAPPASLNLAEPAAPTPPAGADKAPPEPDEPPTVNIYPTPSNPKSSSSSSSTNAASGTPPEP